MKFNEIQKGIRAFGTGFLMTGNSRIDDAVSAAAHVAYLAAKIMVEDVTPITKHEGQDIKDLIIEDQSWNYLNRLKKLPDKSSFYYWYQAIQRLTPGTFDK